MDKGAWPPAARDRACENFETIMPPAIVRMHRIARAIRTRTRNAISAEVAMDRAVEENPELFDRYQRAVAARARGWKRLVAPKWLG